MTTSVPVNILPDCGHYFDEEVCSVVQSITTRFGELMQTMAEMQNRLDELDAKKAALDAQLAQAVKELEEARRSAERFNAQALEAGGLNNAAKAIMTQLNEEKAELQRQVEALKAEQQRTAKQRMGTLVALQNIDRNLQAANGLKKRPLQADFRSPQDMNQRPFKQKKVVPPSGAPAQNNVQPPSGGMDADQAWRVLIGYLKGDDPDDLDLQQALRTVGVDYADDHQLLHNLRLKTSDTTTSQELDRVQMLYDAWDIVLAYVDGNSAGQTIISRALNTVGVRNKELRMVYAGLPNTERGQLRQHLLELRLPMPKYVRQRLGG